MNQAINSAVKGGHGRAVLLAGFAGLILSDIIPTLGDAVYFWDQQRLKKKLEKKEITPQQYWRKNVAGYYLYNSAWWTLVFGIVMLSKGDFTQKIKIGLSLSGIGAVGSVIYKNIKKDQHETS